MRTLIGREINSMIFSWREASRIYGLLGSGVVLAMWVLGPRLLDVVSTESSYLLIAVMGLVLAFGRLTIGIEHDETNQQLTFLQTLPIPKTNIVHAKFTGFLLLSAFTFVWISILFFLNDFVNGGKVEYWMTGVLFTAMFVFVTAMTLLWYYIWGIRRLNIMFYVLLGIWAVIFIVLGFLLRSTTDLSFVQMMGLDLAASVLIYFICWLLAVWRVYQRGIPKEVAKTEEIGE